MTAGDSRSASESECHHSRGAGGVAPNEINTGTANTAVLVEVQPEELVSANPM